MFIVKFFLYIVQLSSRLRQASWRTCYSIGLENYIGTVPRVLYSTVNKLCCPEYKAWLYKCSYSFHVIPCRPFYFNISVSSHSKCNFLPPPRKKNNHEEAVPHHCWMHRPACPSVPSFFCSISTYRGKRWDVMMHSTQQRAVKSCNW